MEDWKKVNLKDILSKIIGGGTPSKSKPEYWNGSIPWASVKDMKDGVYKLYKTVDSITEIGLKNSSSNLITKGNVIISTRMGLGRCFISSINVAINQDLKALIPKQNLIDTKYLLWLMASLSAEIQLLGTGTTVKGITIETLNNISIILPPLSEQKAIAHILGTLDDKIELNKQMNETLEAIARAIFKSWFVKFDPVRAKMEGKQPPGMDAATADLFPDEFEESSLGLIPKGWRVGTLGDVCEFAYGKTLKKESRKNGNIPVYGSNGQIGWHDEAIVNNPGVIVGRKGNPGIVKYSHTSFYPIDTTFYIIPKATVMSMQYFFHYLSFLDLASLDGDSAVPGLNRHMAYMSNILIPQTNILDFFERYTFSVADKIYSNTQQSHTLATIRDTLLPKLISGKIRVKEAEKIINNKL
jgi:type I restriction enzyme S subunit